VVGVEPLHEGLGVDPDRRGEHADVAAGVDVAAAAGEVVLLDRVHDGDAHPGRAADLVDRQIRRDARLLEDLTDRGPVVVGGSIVGVIAVGRVADGHGGAFRACSHLLDIQSMGGTKGWGNREDALCTPSEWPDGV